jgi:hypothetical protein
MEAAMKRYRVTLTEAERDALEAMTRNGRTGAKRFVHARTLLLCDAGPGRTPWGNLQVAEALGISARSVEHTKRRFVEDGIDMALERKKRDTPPRRPVFDGEKEARLIALACSSAPHGRKRWTVRLLAEQLVCLEVFEHVSPASVHRALKKTNLSLT